MKSQRRGKGKIRISACPKCNSPDIEHASSLSGWLLPEGYICRKCGYQGILVKEILVGEEKASKKA